MARPLAELNKVDRQLLVFLGVMIVGGFIALMSASAPLGYANFNDEYYFVKRQLLFGVIPGLVAFLVITKIKYNLLERSAYPWYFLALGLLALLFVPGIGATINGSRNWLVFNGMSLQPSEFAKVALILFLAYAISHRQDSWDDWQRSLLPIVALVAPLLALLHDVGTLSILLVIMGAIFFIAGVPYRYVTFFVGLCAIGFLALVVASPYRLERITTFLHPELDPQGIGYHVNQAFLAIGSGGFWGLGFGNSQQKFQYLPEVDADSVFAIIAEENGFLIAGGFIILVVLLGWRGFKIARAAPDEFGRLVAGGVTVWFLWQSFLNIGAMVGVLPLTGVPLPLVSHGGSAFLAMMIGWGMVANISRRAHIA